MSTRTPSATTVLTDPDLYTQALADYVTDSPTSYHAAQAAAQRLDAAGFTAMDETVPWAGACTSGTPSQGQASTLPARGYVRREGAIIAWMLPSRPDARTAFRILGAHTDSPALKLKPAASLSSHGFGMINAEVYGGPLLNSFLDRELGLAGRLVLRDGSVHLVRTGPIARVAQVAPHLDRSVNDSLHLDKQANLLPLWTLLDQGKGAPATFTDPSATGQGSEPGLTPTYGDGAARGQASAVEEYLCECAGVPTAELAFHDILTFPTQAPERFGCHGEFFASSRLDNLSSVAAGLAALEALAGDYDWDESASRDVIAFVANDHEEVGSATRSGAAGPFLEHVLSRLGGALGMSGDAYAAMLARSICVSADAGHSVHPNYAQLHDPVVQPLLGRGPLTKINAQQRYATDAVGVAVWERACAAAGVPHQNFVSNNAVSCGSTIGPITATRLGMTTVDIGQPLLSMHSQREMCSVYDGPWMAQAIAAYWAAL